MRYCPSCGSPSPDEQALCACGVDLDARGISFGSTTKDEGPPPKSTASAVFGIASAVYWLALLRALTKPGSRFGNDDDVLGWLILGLLPMIGVSVVGAASAASRLRRQSNDFGASVALIGYGFMPLFVIGATVVLMLAGR